MTIQSQNYLEKFKLNNPGVLVKWNGVVNLLETRTPFYAKNINFLTDSMSKNIFDYEENFLMYKNKGPFKP